MTAWHRVASLTDVKDGEPFPVELGERAIALYRVNGQIHAIDDVCTHEYALLSQGFFEDCEIECPLHQARFNVVTGKCVLAPATEDLKVYHVRIDGNEIYVRNPDE